MSGPDLAVLRARVYETYRTTTVEGLYDVPTMPLAGQVRQQRQRWTRYLPADREAKVLDIGCGGGEFLLALAEAGYRCLEGVDLSEQQVVLARQRGLAGVTVAGALDYLLARPEAYALISLQNVLEHHTKTELLELFDAVMGSLQPGGRVIGVVPNAKSPLGARVRYADLTHELSFTPESLRQVFALVGLKAVAFGEQGPLIHGPASAARWVVWQIVRAGIWVMLAAESADLGDRVYTQNLWFVADKA
jgi:2-polyprenyl-3-methyl-5-hydroxy-6-metoxy-1,4-benzoquinol methylase